MTGETALETVASELLEIDAAAAKVYWLAARSPGTRRAYDAAWRAFAAYCASRRLNPLPASPATVCAFLGAEAGGGAAASTLSLRVAAIRAQHTAAGYEPPTNSEAVKSVMKGIRRTIGVAPSPRSPATANLIAATLDALPSTIIGVRDRALLLLGFAGAFRRSELVALDVADLAEVAGGIRVTIRRSKGDQEGVGAEIAIPNGSALRPCDAVRAWLAAAQIEAGPIFRPIGKSGRVSSERLSPDAVAVIVKRSIARTDIDPALFAGHSLRSGFLTSAAEAGSSIWKLMEVSRHKSLDTLRSYVRRSDLMRDHAGEKFL